MTADEPALYTDNDRDALHILPLAMLQFQTPGLKRARMIKNVRLQSVIELFTSEETGSGQLPVSDISQEFEWQEGDGHPDLALLRKLAPLPSFDVYSLRITLRRLGIKVEDSEALKLSPDKIADLTSYMSVFTRPLILQVYGDGDMEVESFDDIIGLFRDPDVKKAREKLNVMANTLGIPLHEIPVFLEEFGDIFLSLSYYREYLDHIVPVIDQILHSMHEIRDNWQLKQDQNLIKTCNLLEATMNEQMAEISGRFENFDRSTNELWEDLSAERFQKIQKLVKSYHTVIGGVLCSLNVKIDAWLLLFPSADVGGPVKRAEFIMTEMKPGIENIKKIESATPILSGL